MAAHDAMIGATALRYGCAVLTRSRRDFERLAGVGVLPW
ncbi:type II toxin-antitoxin system VapC family toxin [Zeimonas sediminis]